MPQKTVTLPINQIIYVQSLADKTTHGNLSKALEHLLEKIMKLEDSIE